VFIPSGMTMEDRVDYSICDEDISEIAAETIHSILKLNTSNVIIPTLAWFFATPFKPRIMKILGHFPVLMVWGTQGSGKSSLIRDIFWPLMGVSKKTDPFSCTETEFPMLRKLSSSSSIPIFLDEFKPSDMNEKRLEQVLRIVRRSYGGET